MQPPQSVLEAGFAPRYEDSSGGLLSAGGGPTLSMTFSSLHTLFTYNTSWHFLSGSTYELPTRALSTTLSNASLKNLTV